MLSPVEGVQLRSTSVEACGLIAVAVSAVGAYGVPSVKTASAALGNDLPAPPAATLTTETEYALAAASAGTTNELASPDYRWRWR